MKILITPTSMQPEKNPAGMEELKQFADEIVGNPFGRPMTEEELIEALKGCQGMIAGVDHITAKVLDTCDTLKVISRYGAGFDAVDLQKAKEKGIQVTNTPAMNAESVGELAFGHVISLARGLNYCDRTTKEGQWLRYTGTELYGKTMGILGFGAIGKVVGRCAQGFGMKVIAYDPYMNLDYCKEHQVESLSKEEVIQNSDVISVHMPLMPETRHMIDQAAIASMKDGVIIVNAARGGIVDEAAAYEALKSGKLRGLGLDAYEEEPPKNSPLMKLDNVLMTPHSGAHTPEAAAKMAELSVKNCIAILQGKDCPYVVNR